MVEEKLKKLPVLLTVNEMAGVLRIGRNSAYDMVYQKKIPVLRLGPRKIRIPKYELIQWIKNNIKNFEFEEQI